MRLLILTLSLFTANSIACSEHGVAKIRDFKAVPGPVVKESKTINQNSTIAELVGVIKEQQAQLNALKK